MYLRTYLAAMLVFAACQKHRSKLDEPAPRPAATAPADPHGGPAQQPGVAQPAAPQSGSDEVSGTVFETMDASEYTYANLERNGVRTWVAGPKTKLAVGTVLGPMQGTLMQGFHSSTLGRTFDKIYFVGSFPITAGAPANPHAAARPVSPVETIEPAPGGMTVEKVFADQAALAGKPVVVRGKVTKVNNGILGKNWVHLQDGTGGAGTNDLLLTTTATARVGDVVVARGTVSVDKDFGGGYKYAVLVEDASLAAK